MESPEDLTPKFKLSYLILFVTSFLKVVAEAFVAKGADGYDWIMLAPKASIVLFMPREVPEVSLNGLVVQLVRIVDCRSIGRGFESRPVR